MRTIAQTNLLHLPSLEHALPQRQLQRGAWHTATTTILKQTTTRFSLRIILLEGAFAEYPPLPVSLANWVEMSFIIRSVLV